MDADAFGNRYPEFATVDVGLVEAVLAEVALELNDPTLYGTRYDAAQGALTAHRIWVSPAGISLRGEDADPSTSPYLAMFKQMVSSSVVASYPRRGW